MHLSGLFVYPVKSLRGFAATHAEVDAYGLVGDRRFLVVDDQGRFLTQRTLPRMALIETALSADRLILRNPDHGSAAVGLQESGNTIPVQVWRDTVLAEDCGVEIAVWLSDFLRHPCKLVRIGPGYNRPIKPGRAAPGDQVSFVDGYPLLVVGESSLSDLNDRLQERGEEPLPMNRFRPNLVVAGSSAFAEDRWARLQINDIIFRTGGPCARCPITTTDQATAARGKEPLRTLATYRRDPAEPGNVHFGQNLINESKQGSLRVGDELKLL
ncbi:MAG: MOSC domain-containing protein [Cephaloticoccus sp.]|nr:MOSC domain-containing protein [Cephaloticoccus sp.]